MKFVPFPDKILIEPLEKKTIIDTGGQSFLESGKVIAIGKDVDFVKKGDIVHFIAYGCSEVKFNNDTYYVLSSSKEVILGKHEK